MRYDAQHDTEGTAALADFLARHRHVLVLTGAGLSTASGIPDYRDKHGVRRGRAPIQGPDFRRSDAVRRRYWARSLLGWPTLAGAAPNPGHLALAALERQGKAGQVITQNVDGLHQRAGSRHVIELHGNIHHVVCLGCQTGYARAGIQQRLLDENPHWPPAGQPVSALPDGDAQFEPDPLTHFNIPACEHCGGILQPDVVFFGDHIPPRRTQVALQAMEQADALLVVGSSLMVFSGYRFCRMAAQAGKPIAAINAGVTRADDLIGLKVEAAAQDVLPRLVESR